MQHVESSELFQEIITALVVGDLNSVAAVGASDRRQLLASGCLDKNTC